LETISKKLNLLFDIQQTPQGTVCFLSCTDFYLEVGFHENGLVSSAKVVHTHLGSREPLILDSVLTDHTFSTLESHLSGLLQVYSQAEGQQEGGQLFQALSATESVLRSIYQHGQSASPQEAIMSHPMGLLTPRDGGLPMKLTYFQHPYDAMTKPLSDHVTSHDHEVGVTASVLVEKSTHHCLLSLDPNLFSVKNKGFHPINASNGVSLPATFVLQHKTPFPVCSAIMKRIYEIVTCPIPTFTGPHINVLIAQEAAEKAGKEVCTNAYQVVPLPSQLHHYRVPPELSSHSPQQLSGSPETGVSVVVVPFVHPGSVIPLVQLLRKQLFYNCLLSSCLGRSPPDTSASHTHSHNYVFDLSTQPAELISVTLNISNNPDDNVTFDFSVDPLTVALKVGVVKVVSKDLSNIVSRCLSIPVTLHAALKRPDTLLGPKVASLIKAHHKDLRQFVATVSDTL
jgi:mediator of RNA polymerase II transcription subunit 1